MIPIEERMGTKLNAGGQAMMAKADAHARTVGAIIAEMRANGTTDLRPQQAEPSSPADRIASELGSGTWAKAAPRIKLSADAGIQQVEGLG